MGVNIKSVCSNVVDESDVRELLRTIAARLRAEGLSFPAIDRVLFGGTKYGDLSRQLVRE